MTDTDLTVQFIHAMKSADGRWDGLKRASIDAVRHAIDMADGVTALRIVLTADWRRTTLYFGGGQYDLLQLDYPMIVQAFWKLWRKLTKRFDATYVKYAWWLTSNPDRNINTLTWTVFQIYVADSEQRLREIYWGVPLSAEKSPIITFVGDKSNITRWIKKWQKVESLDTRITINIFGQYGNLHRVSRTGFFEYSQI